MCLTVKKLKSCHGKGAARVCKTTLITKKCTKKNGKMRCSVKKTKTACKKNAAGRKICSSHNQHYWKRKRL